jgi:hypothetical protein
MMVVQRAAQFFATNEAPRWRSVRRCPRAFVVKSEERHIGAWSRKIHQVMLLVSLRCCNLRVGTCAPIRDEQSIFRLQKA